MVYNWYLSDRVGVPWNVPRKVFNEAWSYHRKQGGLIRIYKYDEHKTLYELYRDGLNVCWFIGKH